MSGPYKVWAVHRNNDERNHGPVTDLCSHEALATQVSKGSGWYGGDAPVVERWAVNVHGQTFLLDPATKGEPVTIARNLDEVHLSQEETVRKAALAKLTPAERKALGL
jgi:hypothetical protein